MNANYLTLFLSLSIAAAAPRAAAQAPAGAVYTLSNSVAGNTLLAFNRAANGRLTPAGAFATGGVGTGGGLGSQNAVVLYGDGTRLFCVDAGSNEISVFDIVNGLPVQRERRPSMGTLPTSLAVREDVLYVLNAGDEGSLVGFRIQPSGQLSLLANSSRPLSGSATAPAQVEFTPDGQRILVSERATNLIDTYDVGVDSRLSNLQSHPSSGMTPFGFAFGKNDTLLVSEAFGGGVDASALSSYKLDAMGGLTVVAPSVPTTETAACWTVVTRDGRYAYVTNTGSGTVSGYRVGVDGALTLLAANGISASTGMGSTPLDESLSRDSRFLYVLARNAGRIAAFRVRNSGNLSTVQGAEGLPTSSAGLAAR